MGVVAPYSADKKAEGRAAVTGKDADRFNFKVPTLRNVEMTYPYFHDGEANTLGEAVDMKRCNTPPNAIDCVFRS